MRFAFAASSLSSLAAVLLVLGCGDTVRGVASDVDAGQGGAAGTEDGGGGGGAAGGSAGSGGEAGSGGSAGSGGGGTAGVGGAAGTGGVDAGPPPVLEWVVTFGSTVIDMPWDVATDASGSVYVAGEIKGDTEIQGVQLPGGPSADAFLVKLDPTGKVLWGDSYGGNNQDAFRAVTVEGGVVYAGGIYGAAPSFGGPALPNLPMLNAVVAAYSADDGQHQWSKGFGAEGADYIQGIATNGMRIVATGRHSGAFMLDAVQFGTTNGSADVCTIVFNPSGMALYGSALHSDDNDEGHSVAFDANGEYYVAGRHHGIPPETTGGTHDAFIQRYQRDSADPDWFKSFGSDDQFEAVSSVAASGSRICGAGRFGGVVDFGDGTPRDPGAIEDMFVSCYINSNGAHDWVSTFGGGGEVRAGGLTASTDRLYVAGVFGISADFGAAGAVTSNGDRDAYLLALDAVTGAPLTVTSFGGTETEGVSGAATLPNGRIVVVGQFQGGVDFGDGKIQTSNGADDVFVAVFAPQ